jgi:hypothetical protein
MLLLLYSSAELLMGDQSDGIMRRYLNLYLPKIKYRLPSLYPVTVLTESPNPVTIITRITKVNPLENLMH